TANPSDEIIDSRAGEHSRQQRAEQRREVHRGATVNVLALWHGSVDKLGHVSVFTDTGVSPWRCLFRFPMVRLWSAIDLAMVPSRIASSLFRLSFLKASR